MRRDSLLAAVGVGALFIVTWLYRTLEVTNGTTVALTFLVIVLLVAAGSRLWASAVVSVAAVLCFNYFFLPPLGTFTIADPQNWVALVVFLAVSLVASNLSSRLREREREARERGDEVLRLFDVSRDALMVESTSEATRALAALVGRRFALAYVAIFRRDGPGWLRADFGQLPAPIEDADLDRAEAGAAGVIEFDAATRAYLGHRTVEAGGVTVQLVPLRSGRAAVGVLACAGRRVEAGSLDALAGVVAIAMERVYLLAERQTAELARQGEALKSALLASIGHDLRTPLTAIRVAATNLRESWPSQADRQEQSEVILLEVERLSRLFQNILDMARIDASAVHEDQRWVHLSELAEVAREQVSQALRHTPVEVLVAQDTVVRLDPRLTASALSHVLENAAHYSPEGAPVRIRLEYREGQVRIQVDDQGPGLSADEVSRVFDRFYRGQAAATHMGGTGMGLALARGFLAAQGGRIWAENLPDGGARFTVSVPADQRGAEEAS